jgi:hypothetical protein
MKIMFIKLKVAVITLFMCAFPLNFSYAQELIFEPIGIMDKPMPIIKILTNFDALPDANTFIVNEETFNELVKYTISNQTTNVINDEIYNFGTYKITYLTSLEKVEYIVTGDECIDFFRGQLGLVKAHNKLYDRIIIILKRLGSTSFR